MKLREYNDWMFLNNLIYKIYTMPDEKEMRTVFLDRLGMIVDFDAADFSLSDDNGFNKLISCVGLNSDSSEVEQLDKLDYSRGILYSGQCMVYRETDIISDDTRVNTDYYRRIYLKNHWHYAAQMIFARKKRFLGVVTLYRSIGKENFNHDDIMILDLLKDHMSFRLYCEYEKRTHKAAIDISAFCEKYALTNREKTVLSHIIAGEDNNTISDELVISIHTLKKHILNIYRKADVSNRIQLINKVSSA